MLDVPLFVVAHDRVERARNHRLAQCLSFLGRMEERGSGLRRMREQMLEHGLTEPVLSTRDGYFRVTLHGPGEDLDQLRVPEERLKVTPAIEEKLNTRQKKMAKLLAQGKELTSSFCQQEFEVSRDTTSRDFKLLIELGLARKEGAGPSTPYVVET